MFFGSLVFDLFWICKSHDLIKVNIITELQKLYSLPRNLRAGNKSPVLYVKKPLCTGDLLAMHKIFIERPVNYQINLRAEFIIFYIDLTTIFKMRPFIYNGRMLRRYFALNLSLEWIWKFLTKYDKFNISSR